MQTIKIKRGLNLPIKGNPKQEIHKAVDVKQVAILGPDYVGMKPTMAVGIGDHVKEGQLLFEDKKQPGVLYTSPACGKVVEINRGAKRALQSVVIEVTGADAVEFEQHATEKLRDLSRDQVQKNLVRSGLWTTIRTRPFGRVPAPGTTPRSFFVNAADTNPLAARPDVIISERTEDFHDGLVVLSKLTDGRIYVCTNTKQAVPQFDLADTQYVEFDGPHPAGLSGTHIHFLDPAGKDKPVWHINYQDVMAIGRLFTTGKLNFERVISLAGPMVKNPRLIRTRVGANTSELIQGELSRGDNRVISGSVFYGQHATGPLSYLGRYHLQITAIEEYNKRELFGWFNPFDRFSIKNIVFSKLNPKKRFPFTTAMHGGHRSIVPLGMYEKVMPLDIQPTFLLRALEIDDIDECEALGCLELDEEDLALCTFVCPSKQDYGVMLRRNLTTIEKEG